MASSATSATSFELIEDQTLTVEEVEMASQEAQDIRTREAAVAAGLVLDEPEAPPSASATDVTKDLSSALERLRVAFATPTSGLGAPGPAEEDDKDMEDADGTERATPPEAKRLKGFEEASARRRHKELVIEEMLDNEMAIRAGHADPAVGGGGQ